LVRGGEEVKIAKRAGSYVTVRDLIEWVGRDAVRFSWYHAAPTRNSCLTLIWPLAQSEEIRSITCSMPHARVCSVLTQWGGDVPKLSSATLTPLTHERELALMQRLAEYPETVEARHANSHHIKSRFTCASSRRVPRLITTRLALVAGHQAGATGAGRCGASRVVQRLALFGVSAPEKM